MHVKTDKQKLRIGIISDTHGQLRQQISTCFKGCDFLLHAGDIGSPSIISALEKIAPVYSVLGNTDSNWVFPDLEYTAFLETPDCMICVTHDCKSLDFNYEDCDINCIICGHTHVPKIQTRNKILFINPGSAGPQRFSLPTTIAILDIDGSSMKPRLINLKT